MDPVMIADLISERAQRAIAGAVAPTLMPLPRIPVTAEVWRGERHVRLHGEAIYAAHTAEGAHWAVVVEESGAIEPGSIEMVAIDEIRCETSGGRRGR